MQERQNLPQDPEKKKRQSKALITRTVLDIQAITIIKIIAIIIIKIANIALVDIIIVGVIYN